MPDNTTPTLPPGECMDDPAMFGRTRNENDLTDALHGTSPDVGDNPLTEVGRYELLGEIARGGMGVIHRAIDTAFGREVAVKVLQERFAPTSGAASRFLGEARITGQLQHPAIPPAHDLGTLPDGRPFLAMKLIRGETLDQLLTARPTPATDRGRFVAIFEQICQAIAYAHDCRVIHRDLKPGNVMVGNYGEVQVMDWGLAKVLGGTDSGDGWRCAVADEPVGTEVHSLRVSDGTLTQAGSVLGTPAFMPPEQAAGNIEKIDERADVFGLGAVLAVILTGEPPYVGSAVSAQMMAARGELAAGLARLDACGAEPELVALCKRCLSFDPADRPRHAGEVARAVAELRAEAESRARKAELEQAKAVVRVAEARKKRRVQFLLAALVVLTTLGAAVGWTIEQRRRSDAAAEGAARRAKATSGVSAALEEARVRTAEAWGQTNYPDRMQVATDFAVAAVRRAEGFAAGGELPAELLTELDTTRTAVDDLARHVRLICEAARIYFDHADSPNPGSDEDRAESARRLAAAFRAFGLDPLAQPETEIARSSLPVAPEISSWVIWPNGCSGRENRTTAGASEVQSTQRGRPRAVSWPAGRRSWLGTTRQLYWNWPARPKR